MEGQSLQGQQDVKTLEYRKSKAWLTQKDSKKGGRETREEAV